MKVEQEAEDDLIRSEEVEYYLMGSEEMRDDLIRSDMGDYLMKSQEGVVSNGTGRSGEASGEEESDVILCHKHEGEQLSIFSFQNYSP